MVVSISPAGSGTATFTVVEDRDDSEGGIVGHFTRYKLEAVSNVGWKFDHFEWDWSYTEKPGPQSPETTSTGTTSNVSNPYICAEDFAAGNLVDYNYEIVDVGYYIRHTITACRAYFVTNNGRIIVNVISYPYPEAVSAGCKATVDGVEPTSGISSKTKDGPAGSYESFSFEAKTADGWKFWKWKSLDDGTVVSKEKNVSIQLKYNDDASTIFKQYAAIFVKDSGKVLRSDSSGKILFGADGRILYEG